MIITTIIIIIIGVCILLKRMVESNLRLNKYCINLSNNNNFICL